MELVYSERNVAFIDILGFGALVRRLGTEPALHANLHHALARIRHYKDSSMQKDTVQSKLQVSVFSDSIVISGPSDDLHSVIWSAIHLQCDLLALGILVRGGISRGRTAHAEDILYGEGMLDAYHLESKAAIYPRIIIDPKLINEIEPGYRAAFLAQDGDGLWFIDPFSMGIQPGNADALLEDGYDPHEESLKWLGKKIDRELLGLSDVGQVAKWNWLKGRYTIAVQEFAKFGKPRFWHIWDQADKAKKSMPTQK
jgi:hypothetical protein